MAARGLAGIAAMRARGHACRQSSYETRGGDKKQPGKRRPNSPPEGLEIIFTNIISNEVECNDKK